MSKTTTFKTIPTFPKYEINELGIVRHAEKKTPVFPDGNGITIKLYNSKMERQNMSIKGLIKLAFEVEYANKVVPKDYKEATQMYRDKKITLDELSKFKPTKKEKSSIVRAKTEVPTKERIEELKNEPLVKAIIEMDENKTKKNILLFKKGLNKKEISALTGSTESNIGRDILQHKNKNA